MIFLFSVVDDEWSIPSSLLQQTDKKFEVIQEVVLLEAFKVNDLKEQEIKRFNIYIVLFRRKILEKNGFIMASSLLLLLLKLFHQLMDHFID